MLCLGYDSEIIFRLNLFSFQGFEIKNIQNRRPERASQEFPDFETIAKPHHSGLQELYIELRNHSLAISGTR
jgi:hypothetical protein